MLKLWVGQNINALEIPCFNLSVTSEWVGACVWGTCILATLALYLGRIFPTLWHCSHHFEPKDFLFSLPNFFPLSTFGKISFQAEYLSANFTVINATQISKFEREGRSSKYPLPTRGFFLFPSSFPTNDKEDCFVVSCACPSYLYSNKEKQKLETGSRSNGAP